MTKPTAEMKKDMAQGDLEHSVPDFLPEGILPEEILGAESVLHQLAEIFTSKAENSEKAKRKRRSRIQNIESDLPGVNDIYRVLVEQIPAVVFIAFFDQGIGETYVSPQIETTLGFTQEEWLNDPVRWYNQIHPEDKERWSREAARIFLTGEPLHSVYRVIARDGREVWFQCDVKMVRHEDGRPWFIHGTGFDITKQQLNEEALREYADRMRFLSHRLIDVQEAERRLIALELHDQIGQILTGLKLKLEMLARLPAEDAQDRLDEAQTLVNELLSRTRELSLNLRPATLDHLGLLSALLRHFRKYTAQTGIKVDFRHSGIEGERCPPDLETAAFRIVQEALTNVARHSNAMEATVSIFFENKKLSVKVEDNGCGFDVAAAYAAGRSSGLTGMRERALLLGGRFDLISSSGRGTCLMAEWDIENEAVDGIDEGSKEHQWAKTGK